METSGIVILARAGEPSLIIWCPDGGSLAYVPDRRLAGDMHDAIAVGDLLAFTIETRGTTRIASQLRHVGTGAGWVRQELRRADAPRTGLVFSPDPRLSQALGFGPGRNGDCAPQDAANTQSASGAA